MVPIISIILSLLISNKFLYYMGYSLLIVLLVNVLLISYAYIDGQKYFSYLLGQQLKLILADSNSGEVLVKFFSFRSNRVRLAEAGIQYKEVEDMPCSQYIELIAFGARPTQVCINKKLELEYNK